MLLEWDALAGVTSYRVRWRTTDTYSPGAHADVTVTQFDPSAAGLAPDVVAFFEVCGLVTVGGVAEEGEYSVEIVLIPPPANIRWE
jgi:hypothetical protein